MRQKLDLSSARAPPPLRAGFLMGADQAYSKARPAGSGGKPVVEPDGLAAGFPPQAFSSNMPCSQQLICEPIQQIHPTGKSLLIYRNIVKPLAKRYFCLSEFKIRLYVSLSRPIQRGVAQRHQRGAGMRWTRMALLTRALEADGEIVWS
jgi:hypothetical protein